MGVRLQRQRIQTILWLGLPIIGGMLSQSLLNLVDAAMVGSLGEISLAGVGIASYANFMCVSLVTGLSSGVQALVARRSGQQRTAECAQPLHVGLLVGVAVALPVSIVIYMFAPWYLKLLNSDPGVLAEGIPYFEWRVLSVAAVAFNFSFRGFWNGINHSMIYLRALLFMHIINVILSYSLIFGCFGLPEMGSAGAGLGTTLAMYLGSAIYAWMTWQMGRRHGFLQCWPDQRTWAGVLKLTIPTSLQQTLFAAGITAMFWIIGQVGSHALAVGHVLVNLALFLILPGVGLGMAATTLVSHSLGENKPDHAYQWGWDTVKIAGGVLIVLGIPFWLFPDLILSCFIYDEQIRAMGILPLQLTGLTMVLDATSLVLTQALLGAGANRTVLKIAVSMQWLFFLPLAWVFGPYLGYGLIAIWLLQIIQRTLTSVIYGIIWSRRHWASIRL